MINILCYGDSNTWGYTPGSLDSQTANIERYSREIRWPGNLQRMLGYDSYYVIEEALNSRTTNVDYADEMLPGLNGKTFLPSCLLSHAPLDLVILMLGTSDLKIEFDRTPEEIAHGVKELVEQIRRPDLATNVQASPNVLLLAPPIPVHEQGFGGMYKGAIKKAERLGPLFGRVAASHNCYFYDVARDVPVSEVDGIHLEEQGHRELALKVYQMMLAIFE